MMSNLERLIYMANQIARNFEALGHEHAVAATADHIVSFWDPRMKARILECLDEQSEALSDTAREAVGLLHANAMLSSQTKATAFNAVGESGHSDAG